MKNTSKFVYDTIIIGAGPAGMTAAIFAARRNLKTIIIGKQLGGQMIWASAIENMPGFKSINSFDLIKKMQEQANLLGVTILAAEVKEVRKNEQNIYSLVAGKEVYQTKTIIIAMGLSPRRLNVVGEDKFIGKGVSYCANCDGPLYKNKIVAVIGGGNAALDTAEVLSKLAKQVYLIYRGERLRGFEILINKVKEKSNVKIIFNSVITEIAGTNKLEKIKLINDKTKQKEELTIDGLFIEIGHEADTELVANLVKRDEKNQILIDQNCRTNQAGIFAAGDVTQNEYKQIIIGCGQGAVAALNAYKYLRTL